MIAFRVREKRMVSGRILRVVNDVIVNGHLEHVVQVDFWGRIRVRRVNRGYMGLDREVRIVKRVRIVGLYRERHCDWGRTVGKRRRMMERGLSRVGGSGGSEWTGEMVVGERPPVKGRRGINDGSGRGGRHRT